MDLHKSNLCYPRGPTILFLGLKVWEWTHLSSLISLRSIWSPLLESDWSFDTGICIISIIQASKGVTWAFTIRIFCLCLPTSSVLKERVGGSLLDAVAILLSARLFSTLTVTLSWSNGQSLQSTTRPSRVSLQVKYSPHSPGLAIGLTLQRSGVVSL